MRAWTVKKNYSYPILLGLVILLLILSFIPTSNGPALETAMSLAGLDAINGAALNQLHEQREQAFKGFLVLSGLKVGLAVLRSSEIGLILNIRIGDLAVAAYDYVNLGWKVLLAAVAYFYLAEYLLALTAMLDIWVLQAALVSFGVVLFLGIWFPGRGYFREIIRRIGIVCVILAAVLYLVLPLSFAASGWLSSRITGESISEAGKVLEDTRSGMPALGPRQKGEAGAGPHANIRTPSVTVPFPYDGSDPSRVTIEDQGPGEESPGAGALVFPGQQLEKLKNYLQERSRSLALAVLRQTSAYLFNVVLVPLLSLLAMYWGTRFLISLSTSKMNHP